MAVIDMDIIKTCAGMMTWSAGIKNWKGRREPTDQEVCLSRCMMQGSYPCLACWHLEFSATVMHEVYDLAAVHELRHTIAHQDKVPVG